jgi:hypothetical protein
VKEAGSERMVGNTEVILGPDLSDGSFGATFCFRDRVLSFF